PCPASILPRSCIFLLQDAAFGPRGEVRIMNTVVSVRFFSLSMMTIVATAAAVEHSPAAPPADRVLLAPHRAIYDLRLAKSHGSRGIEAIRGRILYDFSGNACDGFELRFRQVTEMYFGEGRAWLRD